MDFKGVTWAGNIYQKFEAMCLEVEEVMHEDTIKYVENQVQKVGVSVKKFYAEVMQDMLPPSCVDPVKVTEGDLPLKPYAKTDINRMSKPSIVDIHGQLKKKETEDEDDLTKKNSSLSVRNDAIHLSPLSSRVLVENTCTDVCSTKSKKVGVYKRSIGIKRISKNHHPPKISRAMTSLSGDRSSLLACDIKNNCLVASDDMNVARSSGFFVGRDPGEAVTKNTPISDASVQSFKSDQILSAESVRQEKNDSETTSPASDKILLVESVRQKKDDTPCNASCHDLPTEPTGSPRDKFRKDGSLSQINSNIVSDTCEVEPVSEEIIASDEDNLDVEVIETEEGFEPSVEIFEPVEKSILEESCVLVQGDMLQLVSQGTRKHKSYKKKIREALSSKLRTSRKQDQCVFQYKDLGEKDEGGVVILSPIMDRDKRKLPARDSCESDWELL